MAVIKAVSSKAGIGQAIDYVTKEEKTEEKLVSGLHCEDKPASGFSNPVRQKHSTYGSKKYSGRK